MVCVVVAVAIATTLAFSMQYSVDEKVALVLFGYPLSIYIAPE
jgi:hypothetical protein